MTDKKSNKTNPKDINKFKEEYLNSKGPSGEDIHRKKTSEKLKQEEDYLFDLKQE